MSKSKINIDEILNDVDKVNSLVQEIEDNPLKVKDIESKSKKLKKILEKKYPDYLDSKK